MPSSVDSGGCCGEAIPWNDHGSTLLKLAFPLVVTAVIQQLGAFVTLSFVGRIDGAEYMGAVALGK